MSGDNSAAMKEERAYKRLIAGILENMPPRILRHLAYEIARPEDFTQDKTVEETEDNIIQCAREDAKNYTMHYQGGRAIPILKESFIAKKLFKESLMPKKKKDEED